MVVRGVGLHAPLEATGGLLDVGNSGTLMRLLPGWLAGQPGGVWTLDGDESIRRRPIDRVAEPLGAMGAQVDAREGRFAPFTVRGSRLEGIDYEMPVASAQVKSCVLIAGMLAAGTTTITEPAPSRDHTERMLRHARVPFERAGSRISVSAVDELELEEIVVPGDPSSAAFIVAAATLVSGSRVVLSNVGLNWTRTGFFRIAERMGAVILGDLEEPDDEAEHEPVGELDVASSSLEGTVIEPHEVPLAIDELTLVALLGAFAEGETVLRGAEELRLKESDRIAAVVGGLRGIGADIEETEDGFVVRGDGSPLPGGTIDSLGDHRLAMLGAVAGIASTDGVEVLGMDAAAVSYPGFERDLRRAARRRLASAPMVVAIDGPAGAGKSTVARATAEALGFTYLDSGAMYRAVGLMTLRHGGAASEQAEKLELELGERVIANGEDVTEAIRTADVSEAASRVATNVKVREALVRMQRDLLASGDWVAEGRDIGTVVSPDAAVKVFLTASPEERAQRRARELGTDAETVLKDQALRDAQDTTREHSPLQMAEGAIELDTTGLSVEQVVERIAALVAEAS